MIKLNLYSWLLIARVVLLMSFALILGFVFWNTDWIFTQLILATLILLVFIDINRTVHQTNRDVSRFLEALKYQDFELNFSKKGKSRRYLQLIHEMEDIKKQYAQKSQTESKAQKLTQSALSDIDQGVLLVTDSGEILLHNKAFLNFLELDEIQNITDLDKIIKGFSTRIGSLKNGSTILLKKDETDYALTQDLICQIHQFEFDSKPMLTLLFSADTAEITNLDYEAWMSFGKVISHEILNGITPILSISDSLQKTSENISENDIRQKMSKALYLISERCSSLQTFADKYRTLNRLPELQKEQTKWVEVIDKTTILHTEILKSEGIRLTVSGSEYNTHLFADKLQLTNVFSNLILNSIRALENSTDKRITIDIEGNNTHFLIRFKDNGQGISEEIISRIFVPFFSTKEDGSGIGLGVVKQVLWKHGAQVFYEREVEDETSFLIRFPRH